MTEPSPAGLRVKGLSVAYRTTPVVKGVSFELPPGRILAVLGPNGSGKSTLLKGIAGLLSSTSGSIELNGKLLNSLPAYRRARLGVRTLSQNQEVFPSLSITENQRLGREANGFAASESDSSSEPRLLDLPRARMEEPAGMLSGGERRLLGLEMVLYGPGLSCLLLDEPTAGLSPELVRRTLAVVARHAHDHGVPVLLIEQNVRAALDLADSVLLLDQGVATEVEPSVVRADPGLHLLRRQNGSIVNSK